MKKGEGCLTPLSTIFQLYRGSLFYWWRKPEGGTSLLKVAQRPWRVILLIDCSYFIQRKLTSGTPPCQTIQIRRFVSSCQVSFSRACSAADIIQHIVYIVLYFVIKSPKQSLGDLLFLLRFLLLLLLLFLFSFSFLSADHELVHGRQISGTTGQNFMKLGGVIDICFQLVLKFSALW